MEQLNGSDSVNMIIFADDKYTSLHLKFFQVHDTAYKLNTDTQVVADWEMEKKH